MADLDVETIIVRAFSARLKGDLPDRFAKDIADLATEVRRLRKQAPAAEPETHAVAGTHHQAGALRAALPAGRRAVGFHHVEEIS
jgi:hypothetical protein